MSVLVLLNLTKEKFKGNVTKFGFLDKGTATKVGGNGKRLHTSRLKRLSNHWVKMAMTTPTSQCDALSIMGFHNLPNNILAFKYILFPQHVSHFCFREK